jgi:hypothetical protein
MLIGMVLAQRALEPEKSLLSAVVFHAERAKRHAD